MKVDKNTDNKECCNNNNNKKGTILDVTEGRKVSSSFCGSAPAGTLARWHMVLNGSCTTPATRGCRSWELHWSSHKHEPCTYRPGAPPCCEQSGSLDTQGEAPWGSSCIATGSGDSSPPWLLTPSPMRSITAAAPIGNPDLFSNLNSLFNWQVWSKWKCTLLLQ